MNEMSMAIFLPEAVFAGGETYASDRRSIFSWILNECVTYVIHMRKKREAAGLTPNARQKNWNSKKRTRSRRRRPYTPRPKKSDCAGGVPLAVVLFAIGGIKATGRCPAGS